MDFTYVTIIVLASMIFALAGMMGYMYWQQTRMLQHIQSLSSFMSSHIVQSQEHEEPEHVEEEVQTQPEPVAEVPQPEKEDTDSEDDRLSVEEKVELVQGPPAVEDKSSSADIDDLQDKTAAQLRELLSERGIPFGKRDSKPVLLQLLKAIA
jgi:hypothetical protein